MMMKKKKMMMMVVVVCVSEAEHGYACREPPKQQQQQRLLPVQSRTTRPYRQRQRQPFKLSTSFNRKSSCRWVPVLSQ